MSGGKFIIEITEEVINKSIQRDSSHCMIADAIKEAIPDAGFVSVDLQTIRFSHKKTRKRYIFLTPRRGQVELVKFDQGIKPTPFSIQLQRGQVIDMDERQRDSKKKKKEAAVKAVEAGTTSVTTAEPGKLAPEEVEAINQELAAKKAKRPYKKAEIKGVSPGNSAGNKAQKVGGQPPPVGALAASRGRERRFGLKSLAE